MIILPVIVYQGSALIFNTEFAVESRDPAEIAKALEHAKELAAGYGLSLTSFRLDRGDNLLIWASPEGAKTPFDDPSYRDLMEGDLGTPVAKVGLHFVVTESGPDYYHLHACHGHPEVQEWWKSGDKIIAHDQPLAELRRIIDVLVGKPGAHQFFDIIRLSPDVYYREQMGLAELA